MSLNADAASNIMKDLHATLTNVSEQLRHIKDIRDELNILMSIATFQEKVQSAMAGGNTKEGLSSTHVFTDIKELSKFASQTQEAVC